MEIKEKKESPTGDTVAKTTTKKTTTKKKTTPKMMVVGVTPLGQLYSLDNGSGDCLCSSEATAKTWATKNKKLFTRGRDYTLLPVYTVAK